jgi:hypothetical protein
MIHEFLFQNVFEWMTERAWAAQNFELFGLAKGKRRWVRPLLASLAGRASRCPHKVRASAKSYT